MEVENNHQLTGVEKAAILFICLGEKRGAELMRELDIEETHSLIRVMSNLGTIPSDAVEQVIRDFSQTVSGNAGILGTTDMVRRMLSGYMPENKVREFMSEMGGPRENKSIWEEFSGFNEKDIANYLHDEQDQMIAATLSRLRPEVSVKVLTQFEPSRRADIATRMMVMTSLNRSAIQDIEETIAAEMLNPANKKSGSDQQQRMADMFNKMDPTAFDALSEELEARVPKEFAQVKQKMFTFEDIAKLDTTALALIKRHVEDRDLALALIDKDKVRDAFFAAVTDKIKEAIREDMAALGSTMVRPRDVREARLKIVDVAIGLARKGLIRISMDDEG